jgi:UDP-N-acetylmuramoyl-L-alanyl-D-glutamate--2,6-diaminopimelate ligase
MICVFGCGGDRDRTKRPKMGKIAAELADIAVVTSDNPRTEDPQRILDDVLAGIDPHTNPIVIGDRAEAIHSAILQAQPGDGVLIAGKGHEDYQILGTEKVHFDDREQARAALQQRF